MTTLPMGTFWLIFLDCQPDKHPTAYDSASYTLAAGATRNLTEHAQIDGIGFWALAPEHITNLFIILEAFVFFDCIWSHLYLY